MQKKFLFQLLTALAIVIWCPAAQALSYDFDVFTWSDGAWHLQGAGAGDAPDNLNLNGSSGINLLTGAISDTYGVSFVNGSTTNLLIGHTYDLSPFYHYTAWEDTGTVSGGPGNSDPDSIALSHVAVGPLAGTYLYMRAEGQNALNVYRDLGGGNFQYAATESVNGGPATVSFDEIGVEWVGGCYNRSYLYLHDTSQQAMQVYEWQAGAWNWVTTELIFGADGDEDWSSYNMVWDGKYMYLGVLHTMDDGGTNDPVDPGSSVPEPATGLLLTFGMGAAGFLKRRGKVSN